MAKKSKPELLEEAQELGVDVDPEASYAVVLDTVREARESVPEEIPVEEDESPQEEIPVDTSAKPVHQQYWFDELGNYTRR